MLGLARGLALEDAVGLLLGLGLADGQGEADGLTEADGLGDVDGLAEAEGLVFGLALTDGEAAAQAVAEGVCGVSRTLLGTPDPLALFRKRAAGTTMMPIATVITKAAAPHSRRQKAREEFRLRALRPAPAGAYFVC